MSERPSYPRARIAPYDGDFRFVVDVDRHVPAARRDVPTATDGAVPFERVGRVLLPRSGLPGRVVGGCLRGRGLPAAEGRDARDDVVRGLRAPGGGGVPRRRR
ncbi:MAG: hypothetical protein ACYC1E_10520 [Propionibacteriaceae bacterium]